MTQNPTPVRIVLPVPTPALLDRLKRAGIDTPAQVQSVVEEIFGAVLDSTRLQEAETVAQMSPHDIAMALHAENTRA